MLLIVFSLVDELPGMPDETLLAEQKENRAEGKAAYCPRMMLHEAHEKKREREKVRWYMLVVHRRLV